MPESKLKVTVQDMAHIESVQAQLDFSVSTMAVSFLSDFIDPKSMRPQLRHLHMQPHPDGGVVLVATNGAAVGLFYDRYGRANRHASVLLSAKMVTACRASARALVRLSGFESADNVPHFQFQVRERRLCCLAMAEETYVEPLRMREDGSPTWEIERGTKPLNMNQALGHASREAMDLIGPQGLMNPALMVTVCKAFERLGQPLIEAGLLMHQPAPESINKVFQPLQDSAFVYMMPMRGWDSAFLMDMHKTHSWVASISASNQGMFT